MTNSNSFEHGRKKKTLKREIVIGPNAIKFISLTIAAILAVVYLSQSTAGASQSIHLRESEDKKTELTLEKERLDAEQTRLRALKTIDDGVQKQVLEQGTQVSHLSSSASVTPR